MKLGGDVAVIPDRLAVRAGAFYETGVADPAYANVDFPGGPMLGGSLGGSVRFGRWEIALAYQLRHQTDRERLRGERPRLPAGAGERLHAALHGHDRLQRALPRAAAPAVNAGTYNATSHYLALALLFRPGR